ncbi:hypothetical protein ABIC08_006388 [Bradyrhizobium sp. RT9b]|uniref:hypothetical protein n=1 Tax=Bradyrhizobium sp. RT9b TaxID=3156385 RepID=UPI003391A74B
MTLDKLIENFRQRKLQVDLLQMELTQNKEGSTAIVYTGKGYIRQTEDDVLTFKLYADEAKNTNMAASFNSWNDIVPGQVYDESAYYTLRAIASDGETWAAEQVLPQCDWLGWHDKPVVYGKLNSCVRGVPPKEPRGLALHFFERTDLPCLINEANFSAQGCTFQVTKDDEGFVVRAKSEQALPAYFDTRVEEALRFLLAQSVVARARVQGMQVDLTSATQRSLRTRLGPPISRGSEAFMNSSWQLFDSYLGYILRETKSPYWNTCSNHLHNALEASANSMDAWAIGLGVAVEGVVGLLPYALPKEQKAKMKELQKFITKQVNESETHKESGNRIQGLVAGLTAVRAIDRMVWLTQQGGTESAYVDAWKSLRNRGVHPTTGKTDIASLDYQKYIDELHKVGVLLYHIVFHLIGYCGPFTDYGGRGFPERPYPFPQALPAVAEAPRTLTGDSAAAAGTSQRTMLDCVQAKIARLLSKLRQVLFGQPRRPA